MSTSPSAAPHPQAAVVRPRVVVGVDGSPCGDQALVWALRQAVLLAADLDAVASWQTPALVSGAMGFGAYVDVSGFDLAGPTLEVLEKAVAAAVGEVPGAEDVTVHSFVGEGYAARVLLEAADGADLLVVGSRGHGELSGMLLGSVGLHCVTHSPCPVVVVRGSQPAEAPHG